MRIYAPEYFLQFKCAADSCEKSCCVGWEICIDRKTLKKYESLSGPYAEKIRESVDFSSEPHFSLCDNGRCPHLDDRGLCRIITEYSEEYLSDICRLHPRFFNYTNRGCEVGLGMSCPTAASIILSSDLYSKFTEIGCDRRKKPEKFDTQPYIERVFDIISDRTLSYGERISNLYEEFSLSDFERSEQTLREILASLEYKDEENRELLCGFYFVREEEKLLYPYLERALAYFVYRHCSESESYEDFQASLMFSVFLTELLRYTVSKKSKNNKNNRERGDACREKSEKSLYTNEKIQEEERVIFHLASIISDEIEYSEENNEIIMSEFLF